MSAPVQSCQPIPEPVRQHTPTPWVIRDDPPQFETIIYSGGYFVCRVYAGDDRDANAAFIIEAVNSHATLKAQVEQLESNALEQAKLLADTGRRVEEMKGALRKLAIKQHVRMAYGGEFVNNGQSCAVCKGEWADAAPEFHATTCPLSSGEAGR